METLVIPILVFLAVVCIGGALLVAASSRRKSIEPRLRSVRGELALPVEDEESGLVRMISRFGSALSFGGTSVGLKEYLATAGYFNASAAATFLGMKFLLMIIGVALPLSLLLVLEASLAARVYVAIACGAIMFFLPNMVVRMQRNARRAEVRSHLPDVIDLLEICVSAGMGLDMAWNSVADEIRSVSNVLADEMALTMLETQLGAPRTMAMRHMADRTGAEELASLVALLVQSDRFGTSVAEALRTFAGSMRDMRSQRAEEAAEKTAVKLLFPLVLFIFPVMLIVTVGPTSITLYRLITGQL